MTYIEHLPINEKKLPNKNEQKTLIYKKVFKGPMSKTSLKLLLLLLLSRFSCV